MKVFTVHEAKTQLSKLLALVEAGEDVVIARNQHPVVRLVRFETSHQTRKFGQDRGKIWLSDDFDEPLAGEWTGALAE